MFKFKLIQYPNGPKNSTRVSYPRPKPIIPHHTPGLNIPHYFHIAYLFTCDNIKDIILLSYAFAILSVFSGPVLGLSAHLNTGKIWHKTPSMLFWSWIHLLIACIHNQRHPSSITEDKINKPWRPLPLSLITPQDASSLLVCAYLVAITFSFAFGGLLPCVVLLILLNWYNEFGGNTGIFSRNFLNALGISTFCAGPTEIVHDINLLHCPKALGWLGFIALTISLTVHSQELRDIEGDGAIGRKTIPLVYGDAVTRFSLIFGFWFCAWGGCFYWELGFGWLLVPGSVAGVVSWRLILDRTIEGRDFAWRIWPVYMSTVFLLPVVAQSIKQE